MRANSFLSKLGAFLFIFSSAARADFIDGYIGPGFYLDKQFSAIEVGSRTKWRLEFGRLSKGVELDVFTGSGLDYNDTGAVLKVFNHWKMISDNNSTGISMGIGFGPSFSAGLTTVSPAEGFWDVIINPFVRGVFDSGYGPALAIELGLSYVPKRISTSGEPIAENTGRMRLTLGATLLFSTRFLE